MKLYNRYLITCMAATLAWVLVCVVALALWLGISTHAQAQMAPQSGATPAMPPAASHIAG